LTETTNTCYTQLQLNNYSPEDGIGFCLGRVLDVGFVQEVLDSQQNLFDGNGRSPVLLFIQQRETYSTRRVDIGMEKRRFKLAFWRGRWVVVLEDHSQFKEASFPEGLHGSHGRHVSNVTSIYSRDLPLSCQGWHIPS